MVTKRIILIGIILTVLSSGCGKNTVGPPPSELADQYIAQARSYEANDEPVKALEQYRLVQTVDPENEIAGKKTEFLQKQLQDLSEKHFQHGLKSHRNGAYTQARKAFLTALRYNPDHAGAKDYLTGSRRILAQVSKYLMHTIRPDESLSSIAEIYYGDIKKFHLIAEYNELVDATRVKAGQQIKVPVIEGMPIMADPATIQSDKTKEAAGSASEIITVKRFVVHVLKPGESLSVLAKRYYGDYQKFNLIAEFNRLDDITSVKSGQKIKIPVVQGVPFSGEADTLTDGPAQAYPAPGPKPAKPMEADSPANGEELSVEDQAANYRELGMEFFNNRDYPEAIAEFEKVLNVNPNDAVATDYISQAHFEYGIQAFTRKKYLAALNAFKMSQKFNPDCDKCDAYVLKTEETYKKEHYEKGLAYFREEKLARAIAEWELVQEMDPDYLDVASNLKKAKILFDRLESIKKSKTKS
ncbi:MAG: LysM peptidoglycan-binding domain-containing protein [Desulfobacteraceae bacterium]|nr:LysM peptidoglycan-binding domain-containing protein [Desulfobacteraceae bacterium]